ncbi:MAG: Ppx/GppA phosphatase family protein [Parvularculaceae bacterium]
MPKRPVSDTPKSSAHRRAVIDIGSNSVRLVIYEGPRRSPFSICNEKALCGLGRDLGPDGSLSATAMASALETLRRFSHVLEDHGRPPVCVVATAAVREAPNGPDFVEGVKKLGLDLQVIAGAEEARLAAMGVVSLEPGATGIVGDMGGGSLELTPVDAGKIGDGVSLSIGPLRLMQQTGGELKQAPKIIDKEVKRVDWLREDRFQMLYMVGGAWRAIAKIHIRLRNYPLPILHHYEMSAKQAIEICDLVSIQSRSSLEEIPGIPTRRIDTLPYAALVLKSVIERAKVKKVFISAGGVREGVLYRDLPASEKKVDPLLVGARYLAGRLSPSIAFGEAAGDFTATLFSGETPAQRRIRETTCLLADVGAYFHPDFRGEQALDTILRAPLAGITHPERVSLALALYARYAGARSLPPHAALTLLSPDEINQALTLGVALRFAAALSPKSTSALIRSKLAIEDGGLKFSGDARVREMMTENQRKRLVALAAMLNLELSEDYED